ncbi:PREDICTED: uncharacterized protein LOC104603938 [Nelumbo nucifera]|uniref:Uncharacterized protein n=2 Tax=Nelumbo nucifera TaxID=4432 RepID=A0A822Z030_NELNU|nr:PREDICTED: uncharacterized protein LOC104603938 [Nelumbo nucifera]DAD36356.1 TPA_asm: hypothetical protein HUJ06_006997 [Nelumbo nucifera]
MVERRHGFAVICSIIIFLGLVAFSTCIAAEVKRTKVKDIKFHRKLCYAPTSPAFGLGLAALICLLGIQFVGNCVIGKQFWSREKKTELKARKPITVAMTLLVLSWVSFVVAMVLLGAATSMNHSQAYGKGWLDGECYMVRDGVYIGSAVLILATVIFSLGSILMTRKRDWQWHV